MVGQNPGGHEDFAGQAFVGPSGVLLRELLESAGYKPGDVRATNAVRCTSPNNREPLPEEIAACRRHLRDEIATVRPKRIIALGNTALRALCKKSGIMSKRGETFVLHKDFDLGDIPVHATLHPAYVLREPMTRSTVVTDMRNARTPGEQPQLPWVRTAAHDIVLDDATYVVLDIETLDETGAIVEHPTQAAFMAFPKTQIVVTSDVPRTAKGVFFALRRPYAPRLVTHNGWHFDLPILQRACGVGPGNGYGDDTMVMAYLVDETQPRGLEALAAKYCGAAPWKRTDALPPTDEFALYNARDVYWTQRLHATLLPMLTVKQVALMRAILAPAAAVGASMTEHGVAVNENAVKIAQRIAELQEQDAIARARVAAGSPTLNPLSNDHVAAILQSYGVVLKRTPSGNRCVDRTVLRALAERASTLEGAFARAVLDVRNARKRLSTFIKPYASAGGRIHPTYKIAVGTRVLRSSASYPNVQQLDRRFQHFLCAPPGWHFVHADYTAMHIRLAAFIAGEQAITARYARDAQWDPHRYFAALFFNKDEADVTKQERQIAKSANFALLYMGEWKTLQDYAARLGMQLSARTCAKLYTTWHAAFPAFTPFYDSVRDELTTLGFVESIVGARRHYGDMRRRTPEEAQAALREAVNFKVVSLEAAIAYAAMPLVAVVLACSGNGHLNYFCHDALGFEIPASHDTKTLRRSVAGAMTDYAVALLEQALEIRLPVRLAVEFKSC